MVAFSINSFEYRALDGKSSILRFGFRGVHGYPFLGIRVPPGGILWAWQVSNLRPPHGP